MKNIFLLLFTIVISFVFAEKIDPDISKKIKKETSLLIKAIDTKNHKEMVASTHPKMLELMGGKETVLKMTKEAFEKTSKVNASIKYKFDVPKEVYYSASGELVAFVPLEVITENDDRKLLNKSFMIISTMDKTSWYFVHGGNEQQAKQIIDYLFPGLPKKIKLPKVEHKIIEKNKTKEKAN